MNSSNLSPHWSYLTSVLQKSRSVCFNKGTHNILNLWFCCNNNDQYLFLSSTLENITGLLFFFSCSLSPPMSYPKRRLKVIRKKFCSSLVWPLNVSGLIWSSALCSVLLRLIWNGERRVHYGLKQRRERKHLTASWQRLPKRGYCSPKVLWCNDGASFQMSI